MDKPANLNEPVYAYRGRMLKAAIARKKRSKAILDRMFNHPRSRFRKSHLDWKGHAQENSKLRR